MNVPVLTSADNPLLKRIRQLLREPTAYRKHGLVWMEGEHLALALRARGQQAHALLVRASRPQLLERLADCGQRHVLVADALFDQLSSLESPADVGVLYAPEPSPALQPHAPTVVLDRVQDAGNVGSILRSAAAFGFRQILSLKGTAALWSSKVLRAAMGAHVALHLVEQQGPDDVARLAVPVLVTDVYHGQWLHRAPLPWPCAWVLGHEGQGVSPVLRARASLSIRIAQPGGEESLNVAAAAAICLHASAPKP